MDKQQLAKIIGNNIKSFRKTEKISTVANFMYFPEEFNCDTLFG